MFKCVDNETGSELVSLDDESEERKKFLKIKSGKGALSCPVCKIQVFPKLGEQRLWHFSHVKSEINCPLKSEDPNLFQARAVFYKWLRSKFGDSVSLEIEIPNLKLPRPLDCWVEAPRGKKFAYWILNKQLKAEERRELEKLNSHDAFFHFIILSKFLRIKSKDKKLIKLMVSEKETMRESDYSLIYQESFEYQKFSIPYFDIKEEKIIIYRNLHCYDGSSIYEGHRIEDNIANCLISPRTGEIVFNGEHDTLIGKTKKAISNTRVNTD